jgi:uncharacterized DUF497 family protein
MAQWEFVDWLFYWILETSHYEFEWDDGNRTKNSSKHGLEINEIEEVFKSGLALPLGVQISPIHPEQRLGIIGPTVGARLIQIAFTLREGKVRVISARIAHKNERRHYEEILRKIT